jgi:hypothetical protein
VFLPCNVTSSTAFFHLEHFLFIFILGGGAAYWSRFELADRLERAHTLGRLIYWGTKHSQHSGAASQSCVEEVNLQNGFLKKEEKRQYKNTHTPTKTLNDFVVGRGREGPSGYIIHPWGGGTETHISDGNWTGWHERKGWPK